MNGKKILKKDMLRKKLVRKGNDLIDKWIEWDINNICPWFSYQEEIPAKAQKMRKYL